MNEELKKKYKKEIIDFIGKDGLDWLYGFYQDDNLLLPWGSFLYGRVGMQIRNHLRQAFPEIDDIFPDYDKFEDASYSWMIEIMEGLSPTF